MHTFSKRAAFASILALTGLLALTGAAAQALAAPSGPSGGVAWDIVEGLTTEIGPRPAGSQAEARAREWSKARLEALGFANVRIEPFTVTGYVRGDDRAELTAPYRHKLAVTALGFSGTTPASGVSGELVYFRTLDALRAAPAGSLKGRIAFIDHAMRRTQDGAGYGPYGDVRRKGPGIAATKGAMAVAIRSVGTDPHRNPHTGTIFWGKDDTVIPAGAVSSHDAGLIARIAARGAAMRMTLTLTGRKQDGMPSGNVLAEVPGRDPALPIILIACHLDSWDLGTGAVDDGAGCGIVTAAALAVKAGGQPLRTIRVLYSGSEEVGEGGGPAYARAHAGEAHALVMESDTGAGRVWRVLNNLGAANKPLADRIAVALNPLGVVPGDNPPEGGADVEDIAKAQKTAIVDLNQDATRYFDLHHTPDDVLDSIDPADLRQNVDAWTAVLAIVANEPGAIAAK